jgi:hypothetical protein
MLVFALPHLRRARLGRGPELWVVGMWFGSVASVLTNRDPLVFSGLTVPGTNATDFLSDAILQTLRWGVPFVAGRTLFTRARDVRTLLLVLVAAGLVYSLLIFVELRLSPQLHRWTYGFHQHKFSQTIRDSGYRPMVYMRHGLHVSLFIALCAMAASTLTRVRVPIFGLSAAPVTGFLGVVLVLCKSIGSLVYGLVAVPLILFSSARLQVLVACGLAAMLLAYPLLRAAELVPVDAAVELATETVGEVRADSLAGRLENEARVLDRARERLWFGWSSSGRSMLRDPETGDPETVFDGFWIIALGGGGLVRFVCIFGMVLWPIFAAARALPSIHGRGHRILVSGLSLMVAISMFDLLPNSTTEGYMTLFSGVLSGVVPGILRDERRARRARAAERRRRRAAAAAPAAGDGGEA